MSESKYIKTIGNNIARRRKEFGLTQEQLSAKTNTSQDFLSRLENGNLKQLNVGRLEAIAEVLHCSIADLFQYAKYNKSVLAETANENVARFADIIRPLSSEEQDIVLGTVAEMVRLIKTKKRGCGSE